VAPTCPPEWGNQWLLPHQSGLQHHTTFLSLTHGYPPCFEWGILATPGKLWERNSEYATIKLRHAIRHTYRPLWDNPSRWSHWMNAQTAACRSWFCHIAYSRLLPWNALPRLLSAFSLRWNTPICAGKMYSSPGSPRNRTADIVRLYFPNPPLCCFHFAEDRIACAAAAQ